MITGLASAQTVFLENEAWTSVKAKALSANKMIFMDCYTSWCGPCKGLAEHVFPQKQVGDFLNSHFLCCKYDMEKGDGIALYKQYKEEIPGFPTMLIIDPKDESVVHKVVGYTEPDALIAALQDGLDGKTIPAYRKRYEAGERSLELIREYGKALDIAYDTETKEKVTRDYVESMPLDSLKNKELLTIYLPYLTDAYSPRYAYVLKNLGHYQRSLQMDRYEIEYRLQRTMADAVREILNKSLEQPHADTLAMLREKEEQLKQLMKTGDVKGFSQLSARLAINDVRLSGDIAALEALLEADKTLQATGDEYVFRPSMYKYIIEFADRKKQKALIEKYVTIMQQKQDVAEERSKGKITLFSENEYDILAIGYYRLGDKKRSLECAKKYDERYQVRLKEMKEMFKAEAEAQAQMDESYRKNISELSKKIGMKW